MKIVKNIPIEDYHSGPEVSNSAISAAFKSMAYYQYYKEHGSSIAANTALEGNLVHCAVLEPNELEKRYCVAPKIDKRTKSGKAEWAEFQAQNAGLTAVTPDQMEMAERVVGNVYSDDYMASLFNSSLGDPEVSAFWIDEETGLKCKVRPDWLGGNYVIDVKTTSKPAAEFARSVINFGYHRQDSFYREGLRAVGHEVDNFIFLVIEKQAPYDWRIFELSQEFKDLGFYQWRNTLNNIAESVESGIYPGYPKDVQIIDLPRWAK